MCYNTHVGTSWNKGKTKYTDTSVRKISETMKRKKLNNFAAWQERMKKEGKIKSEYPPLKRDGNLAELVGVVLGDGYIGKFPRAEVLRIVGDYNKYGFIDRSAWLVEKVFEKKPAIAKIKNSNGVTITIYQKHISKRLDIKSGAQGNRKISVPRWILKDRKFTIRYLRGLYEAEGSFSVHKPTYTYKFIFTNANESMLNNVERLVKRLGFHPHRSYRKIQISRKEEVYKLKELLQYRDYN